MSDNQENDENPYAGRDHEAESKLTGDDLHAVAALVGSVTSGLKEIDKKQVGDNAFTRALKINPEEAVRKMVGRPATPPPVNHQVQQPVRTQPHFEQPPPAPNMDSGIIADLYKRIEKLERDISNQSKSFKFKRGISYDISTSGIKGNFKDPADIVDIVLSELAKNSKSISIKLNDANKTRK